MVVLEALALGVPVIAHAAGAIPELLGEGRYGLLVTEQLPTAYAAAVFAFLTDVQNHRRQAAQGHSHALTRYSSERMSQDYASICRTLLRR